MYVKDLKEKIIELSEEYGVKEKTIHGYYYKIMKAISEQFPNEESNIAAIYECLEQVVSQRSSIIINSEIHGGYYSEDAINLDTSIALAVNEKFNNSFNYYDKIRIADEYRYPVRRH